MKKSNESIYKDNAVYNKIFTEFGDEILEEVAIKPRYRAEFVKIGVNEARKTDEEREALYGALDIRYGSLGCFSYASVSTYFNEYGQRWNDDKEEDKAAAQAALYDLYYKLDEKLGYNYEASEMYGSLKGRAQECFGWMDIGK